MRWRGGVSLVLLWLTFAALHDITFDNAPAFPLEYGILIASGFWFTSLGSHLLGLGHTAAAGMSFLAVTLGLVACWALPHHGAPPSVQNHLAWVPLVWFTGLALRMLVLPWRTGASRHPLGAR